MLLLAAAAPRLCPGPPAQRLLQQDIEADLALQRLTNSFCFFFLFFFPKAATASQIDYNDLRPSSARTTGGLLAGFIFSLPFSFFFWNHYFAGLFELPACTSSPVGHKYRCQPSARAALFTRVHKKHFTKYICFLLPPEQPSLGRLPNYEILAIIYFFFFPQ